MPIYEYKCSSCDASLRKLQKFSDKPLKKCPECSKSTLVKQLSSANFVLKGSGWYVTDFKDKKGGKEATATTTASTSSSGETTASTASADKPAAPPAAKAESSSAPASSSTAKAS